MTEVRSSSLNILDLFRKLRDGNPLAFDKIYQKFYYPILRYVSSSIKNPHLAEDVTQEVFLKAFRFRESFDPRYKFSTWLWTIARNTVSDTLRKPQLALAGAEHSHCDFDLDELPSFTPDPEASLIDRSDRDLLLSKMDQLTEMQKEALVLRILHRFSYQRIAKQLKLSLPAVKCLVYRAKNVLLKCCKK